MSEPDPLLSVAGAIAEGAPVAWPDVAPRTTSGPDVATLGALQDLEKLLAALRRIDRDYDHTLTTLPPGVEEGAATAPAPSPARWGHLVILDTIGQGGFGTVYRAHDGRLGVDVALKLLSASATASRAQADRILKEARLLARVRHPNVVRIFGVDETGDRAGLWMEFVEGRTLEGLLREQGPFGAHEASIIGRDLCRAMAAVHGAGVVHGDIKAHNVMREAGGRIVLMDFGAGQGMTDAQDGGRRRLAGTPAYLAPEVLDGQARSASSDIYALGVLLYHLVTGVYPVEGQTLDDIVVAHRHGQRRHLRDARPDLPDEFVRVVERAVAADPAARFATPGVFEDALVRVTSPEPPGIRDDAGPPTWSLASMGPWGRISAAAVALVAASLAVVPFMRSGTGSGPVSAVPAAGQGGSGPTLAVSDTNGSYEIEASFYRAGRGGDEQLTPTARVAPGDELFLKLQASVPLNVYVVDEDEKGAAFLLFPLPGQPLTNPLPSGQELTLPGTTRWQVTSAGEREHFLVFASPDPLESLEQALARLPTPREGMPVAAASLPAAALERLRGVGGLAPAPAAQQGAAGLARLFTAPLTNAREQARGLWVRQLTLDNPAR